MRREIVLVAIAGLASCRGLLGIDDPLVDGGGGVIDGGHDAAGSNGCEIPASFPSAAFVITQATRTGSGATEIVRFRGTLDSSFAPDGLEIGLFANHGAFTGRGLGSQTIELAGAELDPHTCGACTFLGANYHLSGSGAGPAQVYWVTTGTVRIDQIDTRLVGHVDQASFRHVQDEDTATPAPDHCMSSISRVDFSVAIGSGT